MWLKAADPAAPRGLAVPAVVEAAPRRGRFGAAGRRARRGAVLVPSFVPVLAARVPVPAFAARAALALLSRPVAVPRVLIVRYVWRS